VGEEGSTPSSEQENVVVGMGSPMTTPMKVGWSCATHVVEIDMNHLRKDGLGSLGNSPSSTKVISFIANPSIIFYIYI
jgi:hypothetical protein